MKRPAEENVVEDARKAEVKLMKQEVDKKVKILVNYLDNADACEVPGPKENRAMLVDATPHALGQLAAADARAAYQSQVAGFVKEIVQSSEAKWAKSVPEAQASSTAAEAAKAAAEDALAKAKESVESGKAAVASKETELTEAINEDRQAKDGLAKAKAEVDKFDQETKEIEEEKAQFSEVLTSSWGPLKSGEWSSQAEAGKSSKAVAKVLKKIGIDESLMVAVSTAATKKPEERGTFDQASVTNTDQQLTEYLTKLEQRISNAEHFKAEKVAAQAAAEAEASAKSAGLEAARDALKAAKDELVARNAAVKEASKDLSSKASALKAAADGLKHAEADLARAQDVVAAFTYLYERSSTPPKLSASEACLKHVSVCDGIQVDKRIIDLCSSEARGVSLSAAKKIYEDFAADGVISQGERWTLRYCLANFKWEDEAQTYICNRTDEFNQQKAEPPAKKRRTNKSYYERCDGVKCDRAVIDACREAVSGAGDGRVSLEDAKKVLASATDGGRVTYYEHWSLCYCLAEFNWTKAAHDWIVEELKKL